MVAVGAVVLCVWGAAGFVSAQSRGVTHVISLSRVGFVVLYFVPGFLLLSSMMATIGAACNTLKEAQSMASPLSMLNIIPVLFWYPISKFPQALASVLLSFVPPITPFIMILRICSDPDVPLWQIVATQVVLWASVVGMVWVAAKVFRVGVLMYGKPPTLAEMARWLRYS
jgi:ABC-2 type transport system permease protein